MESRDLLQHVDDETAVEASQGAVARQPCTSHPGSCQRRPGAAGTFPPRPAVTRKFSPRIRKDNQQMPTLKCHRCYNYLTRIGK